MTTNLGAQQLQEQRFGFANSLSAPLHSDYEKAIRNFFRPEFINRIDQIVYFNSLRMDDMIEISELEMHKLETRVSDQQIKLTYAPEVVELVAQKAGLLDAGARAIKRVIDEEIAAPLSDLIIQASRDNRSWFHLEAINGDIRLESV
jgi:ATP-dependent Clp protease ATP-binding subunit ClpA